jgi:hypothetical protein
MPEFVLAEDVGKEVQTALKEAAQATIAPLKLQSAELTLEVSTEVGADLCISFLIFTISHKRTKGQSQSTVLNFALNKPATKALRLGAKAAPTMGGQLVSAITAAAATAAQIDVLPLQSAAFELEFVVSKDTGGGLKFLIMGVTVGGDIDFSKVSKHKLKVTFGR